MPSAARSPRAPMPPAVRRLWWWFVLPSVCVVAGAIAYQVPAVRDWTITPNRWIALGIPALIVAPNFVVIVPVWRGLRRIKRAVVAASGHEFACGPLNGRRSRGSVAIVSDSAQTHICEIPERSGTLSPGFS